MLAGSYLNRQLPYFVAMQLDEILPTTVGLTRLDHGCSCGGLVDRCIFHVKTVNRNIPFLLLNGHGLFRIRLAEILRNTYENTAERHSPKGRQQV
jgi:hypothetical protein